MDDIIRIYIEGETCDITELEDRLDDEFIDYDWDSGDRLMVEADYLEDVEAILDELGVEYEEV